MTRVLSHPSTVGADAWEAAYKEAIVKPSWEQAEYLLATVGARHTTAALGLLDARTVRKWVDEHLEPRGRDVARRLTVLYRVVRAIAHMYSPSVAAVFLRSANPQLDDQAPLVVLATGGIDQAEQAVLGAARALVEE